MIDLSTEHLKRLRDGGEICVTLNQTDKDEESVLALINEVLRLREKLENEAKP